MYDTYCVNLCSFFLDSYHPPHISPLANYALVVHLVYITLAAFEVYTVGKR